MYDASRLIIWKYLNKRSRAISTAKFCEINPRMFGMKLWMFRKIKVRLICSHRELCFREVEARHPSPGDTGEDGSRRILSRKKLVRQGQHALLLPRNVITSRFATRKFFRKTQKLLVRWFTKKGKRSVKFYCENHAEDECMLRIYVLCATAVAKHRNAIFSKWNMPLV